MRNRRLTISALALTLMAAGCSADSTVNPEILDLVGTWNVLSEVYTSVATGATQDNLVAPEPASVSYVVFYDDNDVVFLTHYVDTSVESLFEIIPAQLETGAWCVALAEDEHEDHDHSLDCAAADADDLIFDEGGPNELFATFSRNGDNMTISSDAANIMYDFGLGAVPATLVLTMERIILEIERPDLTCTGRCRL